MTDLVPLFCLLAETFLVTPSKCHGHLTQRKLVKTKPKYPNTISPNTKPTVNQTTYYRWIKLLTWTKRQRNTETNRITPKISHPKLLPNPISGHQSTKLHLPAGWFSKSSINRKHYKKNLWEGKRWNYSILNILKTLRDCEQYVKETSNSSSTGHETLHLA